MVEKTSHVPKLISFRHCYICIRVESNKIYGWYLYTLSNIEGGKFRYGKLCFLLAVQIVYTQYFYRISCVSNVVVITLGLFVSLQKGKFGIFFDGLSYFFFYVYVEYKRCFHRRSIAITNIYYIYIIARTNKNNYVLLMIVHNPMDPLINDPSLLHD